MKPIIHGHARKGKQTPEYAAWASMIRRCGCGPDSKDFERYAGRGVKVHPEWRGSFQAFLEYIGNRPTCKHSVDRFPNPDGNYEPGNVRWATAKEQCESRSTTRVIEFQGLKMCLRDWERHLNFPEQCISQRLHVLKWSIEKALTTLPRKLPKRNAA